MQISISFPVSVGGLLDDEVAKFVVACKRTALLNIDDDDVQLSSSTDDNIIFGSRTVFAC